MGETKDFFISYTKADRAWAEWVAWELQEAGYTCTIQAWHFAPSQSFVQRMRQALVETRHLVAILSDEYLASEFAGAELDAALAADPRGLRAKLIPIRVKPCTPDELIRSRIYIDLVGKKSTQARSDLAAERLSDAEALLAAGRFDCAYYIAGYVVECVLKVCIANKTKEDDFPPREHCNG